MRHRDTSEPVIVAKRWHPVGVRSLSADAVTASVARHRLAVLACAAIVLEDIVPAVRGRVERRLDQCSPVGRGGIVR